MYGAMYFSDIDCMGGNVRSFPPMRAPRVYHGTCSFSHFIGYVEGDPGSYRAIGYVHGGFLLAFIFLSLRVTAFLFRLDLVVFLWLSQNIGPSCGPVRCIFVMVLGLFFAKE